MRLVSPIRRAALVAAAVTPVGAGSRFGREGVGLAGQGLYGTQVAGLGGRGRRAEPVRR
jgi:hypothetical protein